MAKKTPQPRGLPERFTDQPQAASMTARPDDPEYKKGLKDGKAGNDRAGITGQYHRGYDDGQNDKRTN